MRVLFICTGNAYRSPLAEALTRKFYPELEVESAGVDSGSFISSITKNQLKKKDAFKFVKPSPDQISRRAIHEADKIICMMPMHSEYIKRNFEVDVDKIDVWNIRDPINPDVEAAEVFQKIEEKVRDEVDSS